jgi:hypothetical protein
MICVRGFRNRYIYRRNRIVWDAFHELSVCQKKTITIYNTILKPLLKLVYEQHVKGAKDEFVL